MLERNYLVTAEVDRLLAATQGSRNAARDRCLLLLTFRHGLRVSEACGLKNMTSQPILSAFRVNPIPMARCIEG